MWFSTELKHMERTYKILVADDEEAVVEMVRVNLEREGYKVITAYDGVEAIEKATSEKPDLIILDVVMPRLDGYEVLELLRVHPEMKDVPVVMLTGYPSDIGAVAAFEHEADSYLPKPFDPETLVVLVRRLLSER
ncbi:MAG: hypothetical protein HZRFUVUK_000583 [Candidatus Fervidibacterota bacterium]